MFRITIWNHLTSTIFWLSCTCIVLSSSSVLRTPEDNADQKDGLLPVVDVTSITPETEIDRQKLNAPVSACSLAKDPGSCRSFSVYWYFDEEYRSCSRFWYGGCEGNENRFATEEECEAICVEPLLKDDKCHQARYGCCPDEETIATGPNYQGCGCQYTAYGCCPDRITETFGPNYEGCNCSTFQFGCCPDGVTIAKGINNEGCGCWESEYGCCGDGKTPAAGPEREGCDCTASEFGCCADGLTEAKDSNPEGCGCQYSTYGCCGDGKTPAAGPEREGCDCTASEYGCCPDGHTEAKDPNHEGCGCQYSTYGCCGDGKTPAAGPEREGCDCASSEYGCCPDGLTEAKGDKFIGCPDIAENYMQTACSMPSDTGSCRNFSVYWYYNVEDNACRQFWYGGCEGNGNRFATEEECVNACVPSAPKDNCRHASFGCCPDEVTAATGPNNQGCGCQYYRYGCCGDGETPATGPEREGCDCTASEFGCCPDGHTEAKGDKFIGCPDIAENYMQPTCNLPSDIGSCRNFSLYWYYNVEDSACTQFWYGGCEGNGNRFATEEECVGACVPSAPKDDNCRHTSFGCCPDEVTTATGPNNQGCGCQYSVYGCCGDGEAPAAGPEREGCDCATSEFGCCPDGHTEAKGLNQEGCGCQYSTYGCCGDGDTPTTGPEREGCDCTASEFGCCPDGLTEAKGDMLFGCPDMPDRQEACSLPSDIGTCSDYSISWYYDVVNGTCAQFWYGGCEGNRNRFTSEEECKDVCVSSARKDDNCRHTNFGCCPDEVTVATGPNNQGCGCQYSTYGCCPNRITEAAAPNFEGCGCNTYQFGCCPDGLTIAKGPGYEGCGCRESQYGCCPDGQTEAKGKEFLGCSVIPKNRQAMCSLLNDRGSCHNYSVYWYYSMEQSACTQFWYGGCEGNGNRFATKEECDEVCVDPPPKDACNLPIVKGSCDMDTERWYYDSEKARCSQFIYGGCLGNANNFASQQHCQEQCQP